MAFALVQTAHANAISGTVTIPASTIGNLGFLASSIGGSSAPASPTGGGTWQLVGDQHDAGNSQNVDCYWVVFSSSVTTLTLSGGSPDAAAAVAYCEFSGATASPLDVKDATKAFTTATTATDNASSSNITPAGSGELIVVGYGDTGGNQASIAAGTGFTTGVAEIGAAGTGAAAICWKTGGAGSQNGTFTVGTGAHNYTCQIAAFLSAVTAAPPNFQPSRMPLGV